MSAAALVLDLERYYDTVPRRSARIEDIGPFTLFVATEGWPFYARPRLGLDTAVTADDVDAVRRRQRDLGVPESIEWVVPTTPSVSAAARSAGLHVVELPLLVLDRIRAVGVPTGGRLSRVEPDEPDLARALAVATVAFAHEGTARGSAGREERDAAAAPRGTDEDFLRQRLARGTTVMYVARDDEGPIASGAHQPVGDVTELVGIATLPNQRRRGLGAAITAALVADAVARGVRTVFLSAGSDDIARLYERVGFRQIGLVGIASAPDGSA